MRIIVSKLHRIETNILCAGFISEQDVVIETAPILRFLLGKSVDDAYREIHRRYYRYLISLSMSDENALKGET